MKTTLMALFALSVAVFADEDNRFQIITHINLDGSRVLLKLDRQTGKTWRYESRRVGPEIIVSDEGQDIQERLGKIIIPRVCAMFDYTMEEAMEVFELAVVKANDLTAQTVQPEFNGPNLNPLTGVPFVNSNISTNRQTVTRKPHAGPHLTITIIQGFPHGWSSAINPATGLPLGGGGGAMNIDPTTGLPAGVGGGRVGSPQLDPATGKPKVDSNSTGKLRPTRQPGGGGLPPGGVGGGSRNPAVDPTTGLPIGAGGVGGGLPGMGGGLPGMGVGSFESIYEFDPTTVKVRGFKKTFHNLSAFSLLHILLNSLDYPVQCVIDRHGIFLMPVGHPFNFLNGKPAKTKTIDRWVLVGEW